MKKLLLFSMLLAGFSAICFATSSNYPSIYNAPILKTALDFHANYANGKVTASWANINVVTTKAMKRYKVVKSATNSSPVYPEDGYITAISDGAQTSFVETNPSNGTYHYRVCAIMEDMNRYCSNVVDLTINSTTTSGPTITTSTTTTVAAPLTTNLKTIIKGLVTAFMTKLDTKYGSNIDAKITFLDILVTKIETVATGKSAALFIYLKEKLEEQTYILRLQNLLDI